MPIVAVTGATGKSGQFFVRELQNQHPDGYRFRFLVRHSTTSHTGKRGRELLRRIGGEVCEADITRPEELDALFTTESGEKVDTLLHIAGVLWSPCIVPVALKHGVNRLILVHTAGIYSRYRAAGEAYREIEKEINRQVDALRAQGRDISVTYLRPTMIYGDLEDGNMSVFMHMVRRLRLMPVINGAGYDLQPVWCGDVGKAYYQVLLSPDTTNNKDYILSGGAPIQLIDIFKTLGRYLGVKNTFISCPYPIAYAGAWVVYALTFGRADFREKVQRMVEPRAYPHDEATRDFGYAPRPFEEGIREEVEMYKRKVSR